MTRFCGTTTLDGLPIHHQLDHEDGAPFDLSYFRQVGTSPLECWYIAGQCNATALTTATFAANRYYAMPFVAPRGGTLDRIGFWLTTGAAKSQATIGIYNATSATNLYPGSLLVSGTSVATTGSGLVRTATIDTPLVAGNLYWMVINCNGAIVTVGLAAAGCFPMMGADSSFVSAGVGLFIAGAYTDPLPSTFPASATIITAAPIPAMAFRFSA